MRIAASSIVAALTVLSELAMSATVETITAPDGTKTIREDSLVVSFAPYIHIVGYLLLTAGVSICVISLFRSNAKRNANSSTTAAEISLKRNGLSVLGKFSLEALGLLIGALLGVVGALLANITSMATAIG